MKLLILGGTRFVGRHITEAALARGHQVTLFNRGKSNADLFPQAEKLYGDRDTGDVTSIAEAVRAGATWDAVIDVNGYVPRAVRQITEALAGAVKRYVFISSISVYASPIPRGVDENGTLQTLADETTEEITGETYGGLKVLCELAAEAAFPGAALIIRPGLVVGPEDPSERFTYYPARAAKGGEMLAPGSGDDPIQFIDARDLAAFTLHATEQGFTGVYNATGPATTLTMREALDACQQAAANDLRLTWVDEAFLQEKEVAAWTDMPLWIPASSEDGAIHTANVGKAIAAGLTYRPLLDTVRDTMAWEASRPADAPRRPGFGISLEREAELLKAWHERKG
ncbi:MAG: NAD-dependent epimerase/dehydratase family protein [Anaerolineae bacterium]